MSPWASGDTLDAATLNARGASASSVDGFSTNTITAQSGNTVLVQSVLSLATVQTSLLTTPLAVATAFRAPSGSALVPGHAFTSEASLGLYRSAASHMALSYGTVAASGFSGTNVRAENIVLPTSGAVVQFGPTQGQAGTFHVFSTDGNMTFVDGGNPNTRPLSLISGAGLTVGLDGVQHNRSSTSGFIYLSSTTGAPTGTPVSVPGKIPLFYDDGSHYLWVYAGASWRSIAAIG